MATRLSATTKQSRKINHIDKHYRGCAIGWTGIKTMNEAAKQIGNRIQELRKEAGMTQTQLAEKCGMAQPNIARIEAGTYATSIDVLSRIAEALGKRIELV